MTTKFTRNFFVIVLSLLLTAFITVRGSASGDEEPKAKKHKLTDTSSTSPPADIVVDAVTSTSRDVRSAATSASVGPLALPDAAAPALISGVVSGTSVGDGAVTAAASAPLGDRPGSVVIFRRAGAVAAQTVTGAAASPSAAADLARATASASPLSSSATPAFTLGVLGDSPRGKAAAAAPASIASGPASEPPRSAIEAPKPSTTVVASPLSAITAAGVSPPAPAAVTAAAASRTADSAAIGIAAAALASSTAATSAALPPVIRIDLRQNFSSLWKASLNFRYTPYSPLVGVDGWHQNNGKVISRLQQSLATISRNSNINVAIVGLQCIYREVAGEDTIAVTPILNLPKLFVSGYKAPRPADFDYGVFVDTAFGHATSADIATTVGVVRRYSGLYGVGDGFKYSGFDSGYPHLRAYIEQNFNLWLGESSQLSSTVLRSKLDVIKGGGNHSRLFEQKYFHSEQAMAAYLESEDGIAFLFQHLFDQLPKTGGNPQIIQLVLHITSFYDVCDDCAVTLFRESEAGRMFLRKLEDRLKAGHYLYPHNRLSLLVETSGVHQYGGGAGSTRPSGFTSGDLFTAPIVATQAPPYVMRMRTD